MGQEISLSVVVPMYNEEDNVQPMCHAVLNALRDLENWELVFVDDGSRDATRDKLRDVVTANPQVRAVFLRGNYGQTPAMVAGMANARGNVIVTMDGDLQNDPRDIPLLLEKMTEGYDVVVGWREKRQDKLVTRKIPSMIANRIIGKVTGVPIKDNGCSLKAYRADLIKNISLYSEMHRFIPAMASVAGSRIHEMPVRHHARIHGESKYGLKRIYKVVLDLMVVRALLSSVGSPIRYFLKIALIPLLGASVSLGAFVMSLVQGKGSAVFLGMTTIWSSMFLFLICLGVLAEMLYRTDSLKEIGLANLTIRRGKH